MGETWDKLLRKRRENCQKLDDDDDDDNDDDADDDDADDDDDYSGKEKKTAKSLMVNMTIATMNMAIATVNMILWSKCLYSLLICPKHQKMTNIYFKTSKKTNIDNDATMATR